MFGNLCVQAYSFYRPPAESPQDAPKLAFVDPLFRRRLSQISRMTIEVVSRVKDVAPQAKIVFASYRGEIARQVKINRGLVDDYAILPAQFSLSVFNTPPAAATIALGMKNGYSAVYPAGRSFFGAFVAAAAPVLAGNESSVIFVYADEQIPAEYNAILDDKEKSAFPLAFAAVLSARQTADGIPVPESVRTMTAEQFLSYLLEHGTPLTGAAA